MAEHQHEHGDIDNIKVAFFLNLGFTVIEIIGGVLTNSVAIVSDALHDLGDSLSLGLAWYLERYSQRDPDARYSYGYRRFSLLGAVITSAVLIVGSLYIFSEALQRIQEPQQPSGPGMVVLAVIGILANGLAVWRLRGSGSMNARTVAWHLLEDVLGWIAVLVVGIILSFVDLPILDPILSVLLALYILYHVVDNLKDTLKVFLQAAPETTDTEALMRNLAAIEGVISEHHTHVWSIDGEHHVLSTHVVVAADTGRADVLRIKDEARQLVDGEDFDHVTVEIEYEDEQPDIGHQG